MESLSSALVAYGITIVFAMVIACFIPALGWAVRKMKLDRTEELDIAVPTANTMKEEQAIAVAIAVARAQHSK
jgi:Na+-transporting methylmalonyl-CoA/oxaloacetate decarboxylase gamma subunit